MTILPNGSKHRFFDRVLTTVRTHGLVEQNDAVLLGVSGGPDSMALLHTFDAICMEFGLKLGVAHLNHGLRGDDAKRDADFVAQAANRYGIAFYGGSRDVLELKRRKRLSLEEAARIARYDFLETCARQNDYQKIATGHQADDNAELVLMNFLRGAGSRGLAGIPHIRPSPDGRVAIIRPLLDLTRSEIEQFMAASGLTAVDDRTNLDPHHTRNRIRHQLIPLLKKDYNQNLVETLNRSAAIFRAEEKWAEKAAAARFAECLIKSAPGKMVLAIGSLCQSDLALRRRVVRLAAGKAKGSKRKLTLQHIDAVLALTQTTADQKEVHLPDGLQIRCENDRLIFCTTAADHPASVGASLFYEYQMAGPGIQKIPEAAAVLKVSAVSLKEVPAWPKLDATCAYIDADTIRFPLTVRNFIAGDRFRPLGMSGSQKVKEFFINHKVPASQRRICPLVVDRGSIIWISGHRIADRVKLSSRTCNVLKMELLLA